MQNVSILPHVALSRLIPSANCSDKRQSAHYISVTPKPVKGETVSDLCADIKGPGDLFESFTQRLDLEVMVLDLHELSLPSSVANRTWLRKDPDLCC